MDPKQMHETFWKRLLARGTTPSKSYLWYLHPNSLPAGYRHTVLQAIAEGVCGVLQDQEKR